MASVERLVASSPDAPRAQGAEGYRWVEQQCPVCEVAPTKYVGRRGGAAHRTGQGVECRLWRCGGCGLIFPNPMPVPLGGLAQHYSLDADDYFARHDTGAKTEIYHLLLRQAESLAGGKGRVLDIGSGRGELLRAARDDGWEAVGIEPSETFARYAEEYSGASVRRARIEECDFEGGSFDAVILSAVLEHLYEPDATVREISRVLRRGGALFVDVPNETGLYFRLGNLYNRLRGRDWSVNLSPTFEPYHLFGFNPRSLRALLAKHGLRVALWRCYGGHAELPGRGGLVGALEGLAARAVTAASEHGDLGLQIETWAVKE
jgi:SAM-dependent methyltransferase